MQANLTRMRNERCPVKSARENLLRSSLVAALLLPFMADAAGGPAASDMKAELALVEEFLVGTFDNYEQIYWEEAHKLPQKLRHRRSTAINSKVELPQFGEHVYYTHAYWDGDPRKREYRNLYVFSADQHTNTLRMNLLIIPRPERLDNALIDPTILKSLTPEEIAPMVMEPGCNTLWALRGEQFTTRFAGVCARAIPPLTSPAVLTSNSTIGRDAFIYLTTGVDKEGKHVFGPPDFVPSAELRARNFTCSVDRGAGPAETVHLHDRGGVASLPAAGAAPTVSIRLRQFTPPGAVRSEGLALLVLPPGGREEVDTQNRLTTPHAWAPSDATAIGLRNGVFSARCRLDAS